MNNQNAYPIEPSTFESFLNDPSRTKEDLVSILSQSGASVCEILNTCRALASQSINISEQTLAVIRLGIERISCTFETSNDPQVHLIAINQIAALCEMAREEARESRGFLIGMTVGITGALLMTGIVILLTRNPMLAAATYKGSKKLLCG